MTAQVDFAGGCGRLPFRVVCFLFLIFPALLPAFAQHAHGRGAMSAQDMAKMASVTGTKSDSADQVCARFAAGSATTAPPELKSQNGVLELTLKFLTVTDSQGPVRYCYVTDTGLQAPTLRVNPGDQLIIHFQNDLPAASASSTADNMAGMKMSLSSDATTGNATTSTSSACNGTMSATATTSMERIRRLFVDRMKLSTRSSSPAKALTTTCKYRRTNHQDFTGIIRTRMVIPKARYRAAQQVR